MISSRNALPRVVIVGRPNVGKSTLFNRLCRRRRAITDALPGVTRDALEEQCLLSGHPALLIDTGGVKAEYDNEFDDIVARRSLSVLGGADIILLIVELGEITAEDELLVDTLRRHADKVILLVNKADTPEKDYLAAEHCALGFGNPIPVSAAHGRNMEALGDALDRRLQTITAEAVASDAAEPPLVLALVGKPNSGKSTLANRLSGENSSLVSEIAGTTRDTVVTRTSHCGRPIEVIDTAGIRRKSKVAQNVEYYSVNRAINAIHEADLTLLLIDSDEGLSDQDKKISVQAIKKGRPIVMALNKWDERTPNPGRLKRAVEKVRFQFPILDWAPLVPISALKGYGIPEMLDVVFEADRQQNRRVETAELNRAAADWLELTPPPASRGRPFKVKYITQVSAKPVRFVAFVNRKTGFPDPYRRFLVNQIRREFGFDKIPVEMILKEGRK